MWDLGLVTQVLPQTCAIFSMCSHVADGLLPWDVAVGKCMCREGLQGATCSARTMCCNAPASAQHVEVRLGFSSTCAGYVVLATCQRLRAAALVGFTAADIVPVNSYMTDCPHACVYRVMAWVMADAGLCVVRSAAHNLHGHAARRNVRGIV